MEPKYKITIIKYEKNDNYEAELAKFKENNRNYYTQNGDPMPQPEKSTRSLEVILTDEEYRRIKAEVFTTFS